MSVISHIVPAPRHPGRFDILIDGVSTATLSLDAIDRLQLRVGRDVAGLEERIVLEATQLAVYDRALNLLAFRARSSAELARALVRKGAQRVIVDHTIARLLEQGLLDDAAFARSFTRARVLGANQSRRRVQQHLARKGVSRSVSDAAIASVFEEEEIDQRGMVEAAARKAHADEFIAGLIDPKGRKGYDAHVGERGVKLSGGQRQRVAIARVLLKNAPILVLDEATSALDSEVEQAIQENLYTLMEGKTVIAVAHRLSTIAAMDRLVIMDKGRIAEAGSHRELLQKGGLYASLWQRQSGGFLVDEEMQAAE